MPKIDEQTGDFLYVRWEGDRKTVNGTLGEIEVNKTTDLALWAEKLKLFIDKTEIFGYFAKYFSGFPPKDITSLSALLAGQRKTYVSSKQLLSSYL
jgi:uncharacterized protein YecE (DUF72 family)